MCGDGALRAHSEQQLLRCNGRERRRKEEKKRKEERGKEGNKRRKEKQSVGRTLQGWKFGKVRHRSS